MVLRFKLQPLSLYKPMFLFAALKVQWAGTGEGREMGLLHVQNGWAKALTQKCAWQVREFIGDSDSSERGTGK